jgi:SAM-dependent methyltransferase
MVGKFERIWRKLAVLREVLSLADLPTVEAPRELREFISPHDAASRHLPDAYALDIGCGSEPANPFQAKHVFGVDIRANEDKRIRYADLITEPIPFPDRYFDYVTAHDFIEHVPRVIYAPGRRFPFVQLMNEIWRTLKPGGIFLSRTPAYPFSPAFRDPTHVNIITHETFPLYFDNEYRRAAIYGFSGSFKILDQAVKPPHLISLLQRSG